MRIAKYNVDEIWPRLFEQIATDRSLASVLREPGMPSYEWTKRQLRTHPEIKTHYCEAIRERAGYKRFFLDMKKVKSK